MRIPTNDEMAGLDRAAQEQYGIPGLLLMEHASLALLAACRELVGELEGRRVRLLCGGGNNGGDGFALARLLARQGANPVVHLAGDPERLKGDARVNFAMLDPLGIPVHTGSPAGDLGADLVVDALLGTGARGAPRGRIGEWVEVAGGLGAPVLAVDIPSGVPGDGGEPEGATVHADLTVTMGLPKPFVVCPAVRDRAGDMAVARIGFPAPLLQDERFARRLSVSGELAGILPPRIPGGHKGTFGRVLIVGGSPGLGGAAFLAARGALRAGAGLVKVLAPAGTRAELGAGLPEAMVAERTGDAAADTSRLGELADWADALVIGPGLGPEPEDRTALAQLVSEFEGPVVVDADGLRLLEPDSSAAGPRILTPHPGELGRLLDEPVGAGLPAREAAARRAAERFGAVVVLKGRFSLVDDGRERAVNPTGSPALATGGTGDVLAGALGALLASELGPETVDRVRLGVYLHGLAGDLCDDAGTLAREVADRLPRARERLEALGGGEEGGAYPRLAPEDGLRYL